MTAHRENNQAYVPTPEDRLWQLAGNDITLFKLHKILAAAVDNYSELPEGHEEIPYAERLIGALQSDIVAREPISSVRIYTNAYGKTTRKYAIGKKDT